jgi:hypothetical protein
MQKRWDAMTLRERASWLCGQLHNCSDTLPSFACDAIEGLRTRTFAAAVRKLRAEMCEA